MFEYYAAAVLSVILTALGQLLFKLGVNHSARRGILWVYLNPFTLAGYALLLGVTLLVLFAFQRLPLKYAVLLQALSLILIGLFSFVFLKEQLTPRKLLGALIIIAGVILYGLGE